MTWEQKFAACQALGDISLRMRKLGDWYVDHHVERKEGTFLSGGCVCNACTPEAAVNQHWDWLTDSRYYIVIFNPVRQAYRWNGFMWAAHAEES